MFLDLHILQTMPPSNVNRDDTGSPKTARFGGVRRARVSSQAWKRATRAAFGDHVDPKLRGIRTKRLQEVIVTEMEQQGSTLTADENRARATAVIQAVGLKAEKRPTKKKPDADEGTLFDNTEYLVFLSTRQIERLAELAVSTDTPDKKMAKEAARTEHGIDVSLFGRMVADDATLNVDAAVQVAHAISTHAVEPEQDYYTAVDDKNPGDETGAGMIGTVEFNSSTLYRYAALDLDGLAGNLGDLEVARVATEAFVRAFITSMPTGKQNTFANRTVPDAVVGVLRTDQPVNLVGAFERAVTGTDGYVAESAERLAAHFVAVAAMVADPQDVLVVRANSAAAAVDSLGKSVTLDQLVDRAGAAAAALNAPSAG